MAGARLSRTIGRYGDTLGYDKIAPLVLDYLQERHRFFFNWTCVLRNGFIPAVILE